MLHYGQQFSVRLQEPGDRRHNVEGTLDALAWVKALGSGGTVHRLDAVALHVDDVWVVSKKASKWKLKCNGDLNAQ